MLRKLRQLRADLRKAGFRIARQAGSHETWVHPLLSDKVTLAGHDGADAQRYQEQRVQELIEQAERAQKKGRKP